MPTCAFRESPPDIFVIDLARRPSDGRAVGVMLRQRKATRHVPLVFAGGEAEKVAAVRRLLPDAIYAGWPAIRSALRRALSPRRAAPVVPGTMDAYAGTPLAKRLGIRPAATVALLGRPVGFILGALPQDVTVRDRTAGKPDVIVLFARSLAELERRPRG